MFFEDTFFLTYLLFRIGKSAFSKHDFFFRPCYSVSFIQWLEQHTFFPLDKATSDEDT